MNKQINVVDCRGRIVEPTYLKRARQLVKQERAVWVSTDTICLQQSVQEESKIMDIKTTETMDLRIVDNGSKPVLMEETSEMDEKLLRELAQYRMEKRKALFKQVLDFVLIGFVTFLIGASNDDSFRVYVFFLFNFFWGIRLLVRFLKFYKPRFKSGIGAYFRERKEQKIAMELNALRKENETYVAMK